MDNEKRFEVILTEGTTMRREGYRQVVVDKETGVQYLFWQCGYGGGITPLLDKDGKPLIKE